MGGEQHCWQRGREAWRQSGREIRRPQRSHLAKGEVREWQKDKSAEVADSASG